MVHRGECVKSLRRNCVLSVPGPHDGMSFALGLVQVAAVALGLGMLAWRVRPSLSWVDPAAVLVWGLAI